MNNERLGDILLKQGLIEAQQLDLCLSVQKNNGHQRLGRLFSHYNFVSENSIAQAIAVQVGWDYFDREYVIDEQMLKLFGIDFLVQRMVFPVREAERLIFVLSRTDDTATTDFINQTLGAQAVFALGVEVKLRDALGNISKGSCNGENRQLLPANETLNQWFEHCLNQAIIRSASDIHIETSQKVVEVRYRLDGILVFIDRTFYVKK